jgi:hypothetical protein
MEGMMNVLKEIESTGMRIQGVHWASVINAWGCVQKDFDRAIEIFETLENTSNGSPLPDAITYEALFNVLVTHRRSDLLSQYIARFEQSGIHMTAYIANLIIKGYALGGQLDHARTFFESLADPPEGVAAIGNHAPHSEEEQHIPAEGPVYREVGCFAKSYVCINTNFFSSHPAINLGKYDSRRIGCGQPRPGHYSIGKTGSSVSIYLLTEENITQRRIQKIPRRGLQANQWNYAR